MQYYSKSKHRSFYNDVNLVQYAIPSDSTYRIYLTGNVSSSWKSALEQLFPKSGYEVSNWLIFPQKEEVGVLYGWGTSQEVRWNKDLINTNKVNLEYYVRDYASGIFYLAGTLNNISNTGVASSNYDGYDIKVKIIDANDHSVFDYSDFTFNKVNYE